MIRRAALCLAVALVAFAAAECRAIEMFTFYGDGSRIGLPSLEVPVEAYPGIPLRSDRIRMGRRRGARSAPTAAREARPAAATTITLREVPAPVAPEPPELAAPTPR